MYDSDHACRNNSKSRFKACHSSSRVLSRWEESSKKVHLEIFYNFSGYIYLTIIYTSLLILFDIKAILLHFFWSYIPDIVAAYLYYNISTCSLGINSKSLLKGKPLVSAIVILALSYFGLRLDFHFFMAGSALFFSYYH